MNVKIIILFLMFLVPFNIVFAQTKTSTPSAISKLDSKYEKLNAAVDQLIDIDTQVFSKLEKIIDKIQIEIIKAKATGKNTKNMETNLNDARVKLADARQNLNEAKLLRISAKSKNDYLSIKLKFGDINANLKVIRKDLAKTISALKEFNFSTDVSNSAIKR